MTTSSSVEGDEPCCLFSSAIRLARGVGKKSSSVKVTSRRKALRKDTPEEFKEIAEYSQRTGTCVNMCQERKCFRPRCPANHDQAYKEQPWFAGDNIWTDGNTKYTVRLAWSNPYNTDEAPTFSQKDFQDINEYVATSGQCWKMCLGKPCRLGLREECHFQHHRGYQSQPWFTSDEITWEGDVMYTRRTEAPNRRKSKRNKEERPEPDSQSKASSTSSSGSTNIGSTAGRTKPEYRQRGNLPAAQAMPESSSATQNQPAESPEVAAASNENRKEVPSSIPSNEQNQSADVEETKEESMSPKTSPKGSQAGDNSIWASNKNDPSAASIVSPNHSSDDDDIIVESAEQEQARIKERNDNATVQNMPKISSPSSRRSWPPVWLQEWERQELEAEEIQNEANRFGNRPNVDEFKDALKILGLANLPPKDRTEERAKVDFKRLMSRYATDKMKLEKSELNDPKGVDCSDPEVRIQAWKDRVQRIVSAKDNFIAGLNYGVKFRKNKDGKWY